MSKEPYSTAAIIGACGLLVLGAAVAMWVVLDTVNKERDRAEAREILRGAQAIIDKGIPRIPPVDGKVEDLDFPDDSNDAARAKSSAINAVRLQGLGQLTIETVDGSFPEWLITGTASGNGARKNVTCVVRKVSEKRFNTKVTWKK